MRILRGRRGQDNVEYALLAAFISTAALAAVLNIGPLVKPAYYMLQDAVRRAATAHSGGTGSGDRGGRIPTES
jgi:Flp pilus assembly pilin Flp